MHSLTEVTIRACAEAVRAELADLPKHEIQELTDGLEADLTEKFAEEGVDFSQMSAPVYAAELREAAGLSPKETRRKAFSSKELTQNTENWFRKTHVGSLILEFGISIRPVWWVLRVAVMFLILGAFSLPLWIFPALVFLSIMWGRGIWFKNQFFKSILLPLNLFAILMIVPAFDSAAHTFDQYISNNELVRSTDFANRQGLFLDGEKVLQIKAFDRTGADVTGLTYQDQNGNPLLPVAADPIQVPEITGMTIEEFQVALTSVGIENVEINYLNEPAPNLVDVVLRTEPSTGSWLDPKSTLLVVMQQRN